MIMQSRPAVSNTTRRAGLQRTTRPPQSRTVSENHPTHRQVIVYLDDHLGYGKHDPDGRDGGNSRNGRRAKTVLTDTGPVEIYVPRDRDSSFEPKIVAKRQRRLTGVDDMVISLSAKGLTHGEIAAHLTEVYGAEVSKQTITTITDRVMEGMTEWQSRPLDPA